MSLDLTDDERAALAQEVAAELDTGQYGEKFVLSRRQLLTLATATGGGGVLAALGADGAAAQASDDTSTGTVRGTSGGGTDVYLDQLRDPTGDEVLNVDDTGAIDATLREWVFDQLTATSGDFNSLSTDEVFYNISDGTDISTDRSADVEYQNTTGNMVKIILIIQKSDNVTGRISFRLNVSNSPGTTNVPNDDEGFRSLSTSDRITYVASVIVPDGGYYQLEQFGEADNLTWKRRLLA